MADMGLATAGCPAAKSEYSRHGHGSEGDGERGGGVAWRDTHIFCHVAFAPDNPGAVALSNGRCSEISSSHMVLCEGHIMRARHGPVLHDASLSKSALSLGSMSHVNVMLFGQV